MLNTNGMSLASVCRVVLKPYQEIKTYFEQRGITILFIHSPLQLFLMGSHYFHCGCHLILPAFLGNFHKEIGVP